MLIKLSTCALMLAIIGCYVRASEPPIETTGDADIALQQEQTTTTVNSEPTETEGGPESTDEELLDEQLRPPFVPGGRCVFCPGVLPRCPCRFPSECQLIPRTCFTCPRWTCARAQCVRCPGGVPPCRCGPFSRCVFEPGTCLRCPGWRCVPTGPFPPGGPGGPFPPRGPFPPVPVPF